jgi:outer membrane protein TolC
MNSYRPILAVCLAAQLAVPAGLAQTPAPAAPPSGQASQDSIPDQPRVPVAPGAGIWSNLSRAYREADVAPANLANSGRLDALIRAGNIYLSLEDTIALALENNLDIELARYGPQIAEADYLRARAGGLLRGVPTSVRAVQSSAVSQATGGTGGNLGGAASATGGGGGDTGGAGGTVITQTGVAVPQLDPQFFFNGSLGHLSRPQSNTITTGTTGLAIDVRNFQTGYQQNFLTGTQFQFAWNNNWQNTNNPRQDINPNWTPNMSVQVSQRLLQGFGLAVNNRNIRVAKNNIRVSDLAFKQQVMTTISGVVNLYWDLVSFNEDLKVRRKAVEVAQKFYEDNKKQVEIGTLAPIEIVRAEARVAQAQQDLTNSETALLQQETIIKNALSRTGVASPTVAAARVIPTDTLAIPGNDVLLEARELAELALKARPDLEQTRIGIDNTRIGISGSRSQLLPSLDVQANFQHNALSGSVNSVPIPGGQPDLRNPDPFFVGGYGSALAQIFRRNFPDYSVGFQLNIPLRNRQAQADYIRDQLQLRQQELSMQSQVNNVRVNVQNAVTAVMQARARYNSAMKERQLQERTLDAENKKYALGASTAFQVVQTQRDLAQAQGNEVAALAAYSRARVQLDLTTAQVLDKYNVSIAEARAAKSARPMPTAQ